MQLRIGLCVSTHIERPFFFFFVSRGSIVHRRRCSVRPPSAVTYCLAALLRSLCMSLCEWMWMWMCAVWRNEMQKFERERNSKHGLLMGRARPARMQYSKQRSYIRFQTGQERPREHNKNINTFLQNACEKCSHGHTRQALFSSLSVLSFHSADPMCVCVCCVCVW